MNDINYEHVLFGLLLIFEYGHHRNGLGLFHWPASVLPTGALNFAGAMIRRIIFKFAVRSRGCVGWEWGVRLAREDNSDCPMS
jgi:hypothetical protein